MGLMKGYCKLCRAEEINTHGTLVDGQKHIDACKKAGCLHPFEYVRVGNKIFPKKKIHFSVEKN